MAAGSSGNLEVVLQSERHSLFPVPEASSALFCEQRESIKDNLDIEKFVEYMRQVGQFIKIAYNGVNAAGHRFTDLQIKIQKLGYDITELCNESSVTIDSFRVTASTVSSRLQSVYDFLLDGLEDAAVMSVESLGKLAKKMADDAKDLKKKFEKQGTKVKDTLEITMIKKGEESKHKEHLEKEQREMEQKMQAQKELADRYDQLAREAKEERMKYERKEEKAIEEKGGGPGLFDIVAGALFKVVIPFAAENIDDALHREERASAEKAKRLGEIAKEKREIELQKQSLHYEALQQMHEFAFKLKNAKTEAQMADVVIDALHKTAGALRQLSLIMMEAAQFWTYIQKHCNSLREGYFKEMMKEFSSYDEEMKKRLWSSKGFIREALAYRSEWIALHSICEEHKKLIDATRADLYEYIKENPTYEQSLKRLPQLTQNFLKIIDEAKERSEIERQATRQQLTEN